MRALTRIIARYIDWQACSTRFYEKAKENSTPNLIRRVNAIMKGGQLKSTQKGRRSTPRMRAALQPPSSPPK